MDYKKEFAQRLMGLPKMQALPKRKKVKHLVNLTGKKQTSCRAWTIGDSIPDYPDLLKIIKWGETTADYLLYGLGPRTANTGLATVNEMEDQLLTFFRGLEGDDEAQAHILSLANREYNKKHPEDRKANPFGTVSYTPIESPAKQLGHAMSPHFHRIAHIDTDKPKAKK